MKEIIRIEWGVWYYYSDKEYMLDYSWDGELNISHGKVQRLQQIHFSGGGFGDFMIPIRDEFIDLEGNRWVSAVTERPNFGIEGIRAELEFTDESEVFLNLDCQYLQFKMSDLVEKKELTFHYGYKYSDLNIVVRLDTYNQYLYTKREFEMLGKLENKYFYLIKPEYFNGKIVRHLRNDYTLISPGSSSDAVFYIDQPKTANGYNKLFDFSIQTCACDLKDPKGFIYSKLPYTICINDTEIVQGELQQLEIRENQLKVELDFLCDGKWLKKGENILTIHNNHESAGLLIQSVFIKEKVGKELQITRYPEWVSMNEEFMIEFSLLDALSAIDIDVPEGFRVVRNAISSFEKGFHIVWLIAERPCADVRITIRSGEYSDHCVIRQVVAVEKEAGITAVGAETVLFVSHNGDYINFINNLKYRNMGNYVLLRNEGNYMSPEEWTRIFSLCREYRIYFSLFAEEFPSEGAPFMLLKDKDELARLHGGDYYIGIHYHEFSREIYGWGEKEPLDVTAIRNMRTSKERYLEKISETDPDTACTAKIFGEAILAADYDYQGGVGMVMAETMTGNTSVLLACTRAAARIHGKTWGMHVACNFHKMPVDFDQGKVWSQNLLLGYMYGAGIIYDEQAIYSMLHEVAYSKSDKLPVDRQNRLIKFYRYLKSHPRKGKPVIDFSFAQGNNEVITGGLGNKRLKHVWGWFGPEKTSYLYGAPEYGLNYIDIFLPGVYLMPIPAAKGVGAYKRFINPTPYGQVDMVNLESASVEQLLEYKALYVLTWNTMNMEIYDKLVCYVKAGGNLLIGLSQFAAEEDRDFLLDMDRMRIYKDGCLEELLGIKVCGKGRRISRISYGSSDYDISGNHEMGTLFGVEIEKAGDVFVDAIDESGNPVLLRNHIGEGSVTFINIWHYPGHEALKDFINDVVKNLAGQYKFDFSINNRDVNYCVYEYNRMKLIHLLSVDETREGDLKTSRAMIGNCSFDVNVKNDEITTIILYEDIILINDADDVLFIDEINAAPDGKYSVRLSGYGKRTFKIQKKSEGFLETIQVDFSDSSIKEILV